MHPITDPIDATLDTDGLFRTATRIIHERHAIRLEKFPVEVSDFIGFVSRWGDPLIYYGSGTGGAHPAHPAIHRVHYEQAAAERGELHAIDGALAVHSAQSLRSPRPGYFAMLMVDPGWLDEPGANGESVLVAWRDVFRALEPRRELLHHLMQPLPFPGGAMVPVVYELPDAEDEYDLGVRLKYGLLEWWRDPGLDVNPGVLASLALLLEEAKRQAIEVQLVAGDVLIVDNNRWAHGRRAVRGQRSGATGKEVNPRELWSVTLA